MSVAYRWAKPLLFRMDPEQAHTLSIRALKTGLLPRIEVPTDPRLKVELAGLSFPNPLGLAAGYDKNAEVPGPLLQAELEQDPACHPRPQGHSSLSRQDNQPGPRRQCCRVPGHHPPGAL